MSHVDRALRRAAQEIGSADFDADARVAARSDPLVRYKAERPLDAETLICVQPGRADLRDAAGTSPSLREPRILIGSRIDPVSVEQYGRLAAVLHAAAAQRPLKTVIVSSAMPREGKTFTVTNLALTLGDSYRQRVLLVDADLRHPSLHSIFGIGKVNGLADIIDSNDDDLPLTQVSEHVTVLTAGRSDASPVGVFASPRMKRLLDGLTASFDWILIDTPPVGLVPDAQLMAAHADGVLLVIGAGMTSYRLVRRAIEIVGSDHLLGTVLNRADPSTIAATPYYSDYARRSTNGDR